MRGRPSKRTIETLEFRGLVVVLALVAAVILYLSLFGFHRPRADHEFVPTVPPGRPSDIDRF